MCNPWQRDGEPIVRVKRPLMCTLFELCCNTLATDESLIHRITSFVLLLLLPNTHLLACTHARIFLTSDPLSSLSLVQLHRTMGRWCRCTSGTTWWVRPRRRATLRTMTRRKRARAG